MRSENWFLLDWVGQLPLRFYWILFGWRLRAKASEQAAWGSDVAFALSTICQRSKSGCYPWNNLKFWYYDRFWVNQKWNWKNSPNPFLLWRDFFQAQAQRWLPSEFFSKIHGRRRFSRVYISPKWCNAGGFSKSNGGTDKEGEELGT